MSEELEGRKKGSPLIRSPRPFLSRRWEEVFFFAVFALLCFENLAFVTDSEFLSSLHGAVAIFASFEFFIVEHLSYITLPLIILPLAYLLATRGRPAWARNI